MVCTPAVVCTTIGKTDAMKIRKIGDALPTPNQRMAIGIQAMGEMGRRIWNTGFSVSNAPATHPIQRPAGTATRTASPKPTATRISEAPMSTHSVPSRASSKAPVSTCQGVGKIALCVAMTASHHAASSTAITASAGTARHERRSRGRRNATLASLGQKGAYAPLQPRPRGPRRRYNDNGHLPARVSCAVKLVFRRLGEWQGKSLPRHHQRGSEDLRDVVQISQYQNVLQPERQPNGARQDLDLV